MLSMGEFGIFSGKLGQAPKYSILLHFTIYYENNYTADSTSKVSDRYLGLIQLIWL